MWNKRVEYLQAILETNHKAELPELLQSPESIGQRFTTETTEDGIKVTPTNSHYIGCEQYDRWRDGKEILQHNRKAFSNPTKWGIDNARDLHELGCDFTRWEITTQPQAGYVTNMSIYLLNTNQNNEMMLKAILRAFGEFVEYHPTDHEHIYAVTGKLTKITITGQPTNTPIFLKWSIQQTYLNNTHHNEKAPLLDGGWTGHLIPNINQLLPPREYLAETAQTEEKTTHIWGLPQTYYGTSGAPITIPPTDEEPF